MQTASPKTPKGDLIQVSQSPQRIGGIQGEHRDMKGFEDEYIFKDG
jgi:hypothetical protein